MDYIIILCTINELEKAREISKILVEEKLAACVNILPNLTSIYSWEGQIVEDKEYLMLIKTEQKHFDKVKERIIKLHPYEVCEVISLKIDDGSKPYLDWITKSVK